MDIIEKAKSIKETSDREFDKNAISEINDENKDGVTLGTSLTNVVPMEKLRKIQNNTLKEVKNFLSMTFGPMGSNTKIITGNSKENISSSYSKDGLKVLQNISNSGPIEMSIIEELIEITRHVEHEVGDGTTSTVILSSLIFERLMYIQKKYKMPPFQLIRIFDSVVENIKFGIKCKALHCTSDDIFNISMISTNGNVEVSENIRDIYKKYGNEVDLSVGISNTSESVVKEYDGLTITEGMSDPVFINNKEQGTSEIRDAHIYHFADPIDTMEMISLFEAILKHNIYDAYETGSNPIPTVVVCPRISRDMSANLKALANTLYQFDQKDAQSSKPPILIVTDVVASDELIMDDIANLCGCRSIKKYIDPKMLKRDQESGMAPTLENVHEFAGKAELVVSDSRKTKFINPAHMHIYNEDGSVTDDPIYTAMINFLETEIENNKPSDSANSIGLLKKRLSALKANTVDYLVGGVTISERDYLKDLVEDAVKNCSSAAKYGIGFAANYEALSSSFDVYCTFEEIKDKTQIEKDIAMEIFSSYCDIAKILYGTVSTDEKDIMDHIWMSIFNGAPYDISSGELPPLDEYSENVKCSIMLDVHILDTISKIITVMVTSNQCLLQAPQLNKY